MRIDPRHGTCKECEAELEIIDACDSSMTVWCSEGHIYDVEPDALGADVMHYYVPFYCEHHQREF